MTVEGPLYIDTAKALEAWVNHASKATLVAVDTESDSFHRYREKVCLIQMTALGLDAIIDPLALDSLKPLEALFADPRYTKIFHDAGYDLICLHRDYGFKLRGLFDTMLASRLLGHRAFGLAVILRERFGFEANKKLQRSDWAQRPLSAEQLAYARYDTHFLPQLTEMLTAELKAAGRLDWALEDFARLPELSERAPVRDTAVDEHGFWRVQGSKALTPPQRGRLRALWNLRDRLAERMDRPPFKVFGDWVLMELSKNAPTSLNDMRPRPGLRRAGIDKFGPEIMAALAHAEPVKGGPPPGSGRRRRSGRLLDPDARDRYEALRDLRRSEADGLNLEPEVLLGNALLEDLARRPPTLIGELQERPELRGWRGPYLCKPILQLLTNPLPPRAPKPQRPGVLAADDILEAADVLEEDTAGDADADY